MISIKLGAVRLYLVKRFANLSMHFLFPCSQILSPECNLHTPARVYIRLRFSFVNFNAKKSQTFLLLVFGSRPVTLVLKGWFPLNTWVRCGEARYAGSRCPPKCPPKTKMSLPCSALVQGVTRPNRPWPLTNIVKLSTTLSVRLRGRIERFIIGFQSRSSHGATTVYVAVTGTTVSRWGEVNKTISSPPLPSPRGEASFVSIAPRDL